MNIQYIRRRATSELNPRQKLFITGGGIVILLLLLGYGGIFTQISTLEDVARSYRELKKEEKRLLAQKEEGEILQNEILLLDTYEDVLDKVFLKKEDLVEFIGMAEQSSRAHGITLTITPRPDAQRRQGFAFRFVAQDSFPSVIQFIDELQNFPFFVQLERLSIGSNFNPAVKIRNEQARGGVRATLDIFVPTKD